MPIVSPALDALVQLLITVPFVLLAGRRGGLSRPRLLGIAAGIFLATSILTDLLARVSLFPGQQWNWAGKGAAFLLALGFVAALRSFAPAGFGLTARIERAGSRPIFFVCAVYLLLRVAALAASAKGRIEWHTETVLFQATLPGLAEELIFRGLILTLLNQVLAGARRTLLGVSFGWAAVITSLLFGAAHGLSLGNDLHLRFQAFAFGRAAFDGFLFALLMEKTKSLVPGIVFHNLLNLIGNH